MSSASNPKPVVTGYPAAPPPPAGGAAYPYSAPPPSSGGAAYPTAYRPSHYPNGAAPSPHPKGPPAHAFCLVALVIIGCGILILLIPIISQLDRLPLPAFAVSSASVSAFNLSAPQHLLSSDFDISLSVRNTNHKMGINYESFAAAVFYGSYEIAETSLPPFYQDKGSATTIRARIVAAAEYVEDDVAKGIAADRGRDDGVVNFNVRVFAWVWFVDGKQKTDRKMMSVYCEDVPVGFKNGTVTVDGSLVGSPKQCKVDL